MLESNGDDAQEEEDDTVRQGTHGLDGVLHCCVALLGNVWEGVTLLSYATSYLKMFKAGFEKALLSPADLLTRLNS